MYLIISDGKHIASCEKPLYVRKNDNGIYVKCGKAEADALSVNGILYNVEGKNAIPNAPEAIAVECDAAEQIFKGKEQSDRNEKSCNSIESALCEIDSEADDRLSALEEALCEIDGILNGGV